MKQSNSHKPEDNYQNRLIINQNPSPDHINKDQSSNLNYSQQQRQSSKKQSLQNQFSGYRSSNLQDRNANSNINFSRTSDYRNNLNLNNQEISQELRIVKKNQRTQKDLVYANSTSDNQSSGVIPYRDGHIRSNQKSHQEISPPGMDHHRKSQDYDLSSRHSNFYRERELRKSKAEQSKLNNKLIASQAKVSFTQKKWGNMQKHYAPHNQRRQSSINGLSMVNHGQNKQSFNQNFTYNIFAPQQDISQMVSQRNLTPQPETSNITQPFNSQNNSSYDPVDQIIQRKVTNEDLSESRYNQMDYKIKRSPEITLIPVDNQFTLTNQNNSPSKRLHFNSKGEVNLKKFQNAVEKTAIIKRMKDRAAKRKEMLQKCKQTIGSEQIDKSKISHFETYYRNVRGEPFKEPAILPQSDYDLLYLKKKRRIANLYEQQAILYGVDVLDTYMLENLDNQQDLRKYHTRKEKKREETEKMFQKTFLIANINAQDLEETLKNREAGLQSNRKQDNDKNKMAKASLMKNNSKRKVNNQSPDLGDLLVIKIDSTWKSVFDVIMLLSSCYNTFSQAKYAAFGNPTNFYQNLADYFIEVLFFLDFIFCFCQEYKDEETYTIVSDIKKIAKHYLKGSCIFDLLANIPFEVFFASNLEDPHKSRLFRLFKLLRVPRLFELLNVDRIKQTINDYYSKRLHQAVKNNEVETESYPILNALMYVQLYKVFRLILIIFTSSYFLGILWHIYAVDVIETKYVNDDFYQGAVSKTFVSEKLEYHPGNKDTDGEKLIKVWYYAITTLSTIGFGDFSPVSTKERFITSFILLFGVAIFSFITGQFIEILMNYKSLWKVGHHKDLSKWIALLSRFNNGNPLKKELITKIEDFFDYYWDNNRLSAMRSEQDLRFMDELPYYVQGEIFIDYLFNDFLYKYKSYFKPQTVKFTRETAKLFVEKTNHDFKRRKFLVEFVKRLEPRFYTQHGDFIQEQYEEIFEVVFVTKGSVAVGYRLFSEIFYGKQITMTKFKKIISVINDYSCLYSKCSEFLYKPVDYVEALAMRKENFNEVMQESQAKLLKPEIARNYKYIIQDPLHEHRNERSKRFQGRIDYVDMGAYGIGKVNVNQEKLSQKPISHFIDANEFSSLEKQSVSDISWEEQVNTHGQSLIEQKFFEKVSNFDSLTDNLSYRICTMALRQDERMKMVTGQVKIDEYQKTLTHKVLQIEEPQANQEKLYRRQNKSFRLVQVLDYTQLRKQIQQKNIIGQ